MTCLFQPEAVRASLLIALMGFLGSISTASATLIVSGTGTSAAGNPLAASAEFTIVGDSLTLRLLNASPVESQAAADVLTSFYFDVVDGDGIRPTLALASFNQNGYVWQVRKDAVDLPFNYSPPSVPANYQAATGGVEHVPSDLRAFANNDRTWQFRAMDSSLPPYEGFGLGTVGNSGLSPNGFDPFIVGPPGNGQIAFGIYRDLDGDIQPLGTPMQDQFLVRNEATFVFSGLTGYTEADIVPAVFGFGTGPDSTITAPEPDAGGLTVAALAAAGGLSAWRRSRLLRASSRALGSAVATGDRSNGLAGKVSGSGPMALFVAEGAAVALVNSVLAFVSSPASREPSRCMPKSSGGAHPLSATATPATRSSSGPSKPDSTVHRLRALETSSELTDGCRQPRRDRSMRLAGIVLSHVAGPGTKPPSSLEGRASGRDSSAPESGSTSAMAS